MYRIPAILFVLFLPSVASADDKAIAEFYAKRTVTIAVGFSPGGNYDLYARLVSRHIGKHIPGNPTVIVQNMPGRQPAARQYARQCRAA